MLPLLPFPGTAWAQRAPSPGALWAQHHLGTGTELCQRWGHLPAAASPGHGPTAPHSPPQPQAVPSLGIIPRSFLIRCHHPSQPEQFWLQLARTGGTSGNFSVILAVPKGWEQSGSCGPTSAHRSCQGGSRLIPNGSRAGSVRASATLQLCLLRSLSLG